MNEKSLRYRRTRLERESVDWGYKFYFTTNFEKPFITIDSKTIQFKSRKAAADYGQAMSMIKLYQERLLSHPGDTLESMKIERLILYAEGHKTEALKKRIDLK